MSGLLVAAASGAVLALAITWAMRRRPRPRHRAGPGRPASTPIPASPSGERPTAPFFLLSFDREQTP